MSAIANLSFFDGASTPVTHFLSPLGVRPEKDVPTARWREVVANVPFDSQINALMALQRLKSGIFRSEFRVVVPVMEAISGQNLSGYTAAPKTAYEDMFMLVGFHSPRSTVASRRLARQSIINMAGGITSSVTPLGSHPYADLADYLIMPT